MSGLLCRRSVSDPVRAECAVFAGEVVELPQSVHAAADGPDLVFQGDDDKGDLIQGGIFDGHVGAIHPDPFRQGLQQIGVLLFQLVEQSAVLEHEGHSSSRARRNPGLPVLRVRAGAKALFSDSGQALNLVSETR